MKIAVTGATGLIGVKLCNKLITEGNSLLILTRDPEKAKEILPAAEKYICWNYEKPDSWRNSLEGVDSVVHLAGTNLFAKRWSSNFKKEIIKSREISTRNLIGSLGELKHKPGSFICASGINYYGDSGDKLLMENSPAGEDFLARVCVAWEKEAEKAARYGIRHVSIRTGIVLDNKGGALSRMVLPFKMFAGGPLGSGEQWFPWIHIDDLVNIYLFAIHEESLSGGVNGCSPNPVTMNEFAKSLGKVLHRPSIFKVPSFVLKIALGDSSEAVTASVRAIPEKLLKSGTGFKFGYEVLNDALKNILK